MLTLQQTEQQIDKSTTRFMLGSIVFLTSWSLVSSTLHAGSITATTVTFILYPMYWIYTLRTKNQLLLRLLIFSTVAGFLELFADFYLVEGIDSLVYPQDKIMLMESPVYMPFAWSNILLQLSFLGLLFSQNFGKVKAALLLALFGSLYIPLYEYLAENADWWVYNNNAIKILNAPLYVILCEGLIALSLPFLAHWMLKKSPLHAIGFGILEGIWIMIGVLVTFAVAG